MSSGVDSSPRRASLRAVAHPLRLRMLTLLTGTARSAADIARELDITHANASYHLRQLYAAGLLVVADEQSIRGGRAKRYRHYPAVEALPPVQPQDAPAAELWVDPVVWAEIVGAVQVSYERLHEAARPPWTPGTVRTSTAIAMFVIDPARTG